MSTWMRFDVVGIPKPGGSKKAFYNKKLGRALIVDACKKNKQWRDTVADTAVANRCPTYGGALVIEVHFRMPRPKWHFGAKGLRPSAPAHHTTKPDATKLLRSTEDALTGIAWRDDSQIVMQTVTKAYCAVGEYPGAEIRITELEADHG